MELTDDVYLRFVGHDKVIRTLSDTGLLELDGVMYARHSVAVSAGCWAAAALCGGIDEVDVVHAVFGALLHDCFRCYAAEAAKRSGDGSSGAPRSATAYSQSALLRKYGWHDAVVVCARPVDYASLSEVDFEVGARVDRVIVRVKESVSLARQFILLSHYVMGDEKNPGLPSWSVYDWIVPQLAAGVISDHTGFLSALLREAPRLYNLSLERYEFLNTEPVNN